MCVACVCDECDKINKKQRVPQRATLAQNNGISTVYTNKMDMEEESDGESLGESDGESLLGESDGESLGESDGEQQLPRHQQQVHPCVLNGIAGRTYPYYCNRRHNVIVDNERHFGNGAVDGAQPTVSL
jgi:hypothetical protein